MSVNPETPADARARSAIFSRLRAASAGTPVAVPDIAAYYRERPQPAAGESRRERFIRNARSWRAEVIETTADDWPRALAGVIVDKNSQTLLLGANTDIAPVIRAQLPAERLYWYERDLSEIKRDIFERVDTGITTTIGAVAETGSLLLWPTVNEPRTLSLVPPLHIAILHERCLYETLYDAMHAQGWAADMPSNAVMITGPSKTADIQRMLVYGAHGPKELVILLLRDADGVAA